MFSFYTAFMVMWLATTQYAQGDWVVGLFCLAGAIEILKTIWRTM